RAADLAASKRFVFLEPVRTGDLLLPVLGVTFDFEANPAKLSLQVGLFRTIKEGAKAPNALAFRFETPEEGGGAHRYHHSQVIREFRCGLGTRWIPTPEWLPVTQPAFALDAKSPAMLLLAMLISVYGAEVGRWLLEGGLGPEVSGYIGQMHFP